MSEYHTVSVEFQDEECLVEALKAMGYNPLIHKEAVNLYGYQNDQRSQKANIIIHRSQVGSASNDVGFLKKTSGGFEMIVSEYDQKTNFNQKRVDKLKQTYAEKVIIKHAKKAKHKIKSQEVQADGSIKIRVRLR